MKKRLKSGMSFTRRDTIKIFKLSSKGLTISEIAKECSVSENKIKEILE